MAINRIYSDRDAYEVGEGNVSEIKLTNHGDRKTTIYKVVYEDESLLFVGLLEHEVERAEIQEQTDIFEYL